MIHEHLNAMRGMGYLCCTLHLYKVQWLGDSVAQMKQFMSSWEYVLNNMDPKEIPSDVALTDILSNCLSKSKTMKMDYELFDRMDIGHADRNPRYLILQIEKKVRKILAENNKAKILDAHTARAQGYTPGFGSPADAAALPGQDAGQFTGTYHYCGEIGHYANACPNKQNGKGKGKGKGKGGSDPLGRTKEQLGKIHCYFFHHGGP